MSKITLDNLSDNLKAYLEGLGLTEEQVLNLINENGLNEEELKAMLKDSMSINELNTNSKTIIGAINELFQDVDNGKNLIATSIGNPLITGNSTFNAMSEAIEDIHADREEDRQKLIDILVGSNIELTGKESFEELIDKIDINDGIIVRNCGIKQIACGNENSFILKTDGSLWACGKTDYAQFGLGDDITDKSTFIHISKNVKQVACGQYHTVILKNDGSVWGCGINDTGQLGLGDITNRNTFTQITTNIDDVKQIACGERHTFILKNDGSLWACGLNSSGQLGLGDITDRNTFTKVINNVDNDVKQIACGYCHTVIIKTDDSVWICGDNYRGQLGLGDTTNRLVFTELTNNAKQIGSTYQTTFIVKNDGSLWSCGYNYHGELGLGSSGIENYTATLLK